MKKQVNVVNADLQRREVHGEGQAHGKECEEPCRQGNGAKSDNPVQRTRNDLEKETEQPPNPPRHGGRRRRRRERRGRQMGGSNACTPR